MQAVDVVGWGAVTPAGSGVDALWASALDGESFARVHEIHPDGEDPMPVVVSSSPSSLLSIFMKKAFKKLP